MSEGQLHVLIVDDSADNALMLRVLLKLEGYAARIATDGPAALAAARTSPPDVVLIDVGLPGMSGCDLAAELRRIPELGHCRLAAVTGHGEDALPSPSPFDGYFRKPVLAEDLLAYLARIQHQATGPTAAVACAGQATAT
jgi:CheY-like chemotaxis protein